MSGNFYESIVALRDSIPGAFINEGAGGGLRAGALFSADGAYRLLIWRVWNDVRGLTRPNACEHLCAWVKHNPSKASGTRSDNTFTDAENRGRRWGFDGLLMANLGSYVATDPADFAKALDPEGPRNRQALEFVLDHAAQVFVGWGNYGGGRIRGIMLRCEHQFVDMAKRRKVDLWCLGENANGSPKHLLSRGRGRIPKDAQPERWR